MSISARKAKSKFLQVCIDSSRHVRGDRKVESLFVFGVFRGNIQCPQLSSSDQLFADPHRSHRTPSGDKVIAAVFTAVGLWCRFVLIGGAALFPTTDSRLSALSPKTPRTLEARPNWGGSFPMANRSEVEKILEVAVAGIPRIAKVIADFPIEFREGALEVAERRYQQTVCDLGYAEGDAQGWISVVMFRLRRQVAELSTTKLDGSGSEAEKSVKISRGG